MPAVRAELTGATASTASFLVSTIGCSEVLYGYAKEGVEPALNQRLSTGGTGTRQLSLDVEDLAPGTAYQLGIQGKGPAGEEGKVQYVPFQTQSGCSLPHPADMTLIPGHSSHRSPLAWSKDRWLRHVVYTDENGQDHWFFDSFLLIEGQQNGKYGGPIITYSVTDEDRPSATKEYWQQQLDFWFKGGDFPWQESYWGDGVNTFARWYTGNTQTIHFSSGQLDALDECISDEAAKIGAPPTKRYVVMSLPEPIYFDNYIRGVQNGGNTVYWGSINGKALDFSKVEDRIEACKWFMDETRRAFASKHYKNIELLGFYVLPEVLSTTWRKEYKRYDVLIPALSAYAHAGNQWLYWIPYCMAEGYTRWKEFGIDLAYMQPNYYWDAEKKPMSTTFQEINKYQMGLELEFEYSMVEAVNGASSAALYRARFDEYLEWAKRSGVYGIRSIALYSGTDAMEQLADSPLEGDRAMYHKLGHFIIESPLKKQ